MDRLAHSVAEIQLYFILTPCPACGLTALRPRGPFDAADAPGGRTIVRAACARCLREYPDGFVVSPQPMGVVGEVMFNATTQPSELIDVVGWIALYRTIVEQAWQETDKRSARRLAWEAGLCLDEALKFYPRGERFPISEGFFTPESRARFQSFRGQFDREMVLHHRRQAPNLTAEERRSEAGEARGGWWKFWQKHIEPRMGWQPDHG